MVEPCPWQMLFPTQLEGEAEAAAVPRVPAVSIPMHFRWITHPGKGAGRRAGSGVGMGSAGGASRARCWLLLEEQDMFCMRLGVFGVVVSVGDAVALFRLGVRSEGRLDVLLF